MIDSSSKKQWAPNLAVSLVLAFSTTAAAGGGLFWKSVYLHETLSWAVQLRGGDAVTLVLAVPVLLISTLFARRGSLAALLVWQGVLLLFLYDYALLAFAVHFNVLFPVYCIILGLSFYFFLGSLLRSPLAEIADRYGGHAPARTMSVVFFALSFAFAAHSMSEILPALLAGKAPSGVVECGLLTDPAHVLDLSLYLPAFAVAGVLLLRRRPLAYLLAPVMMVFGLLMTVTVAGIMMASARAGLSNDSIAAVLFLGAALGCGVLLFRYFRGGAPSRAKSESV